jgi:UDP-N-acetyl-D-mannosaminuronic acid transferase (WecB/TagA/CpsF family)
MKRGNRESDIRRILGVSFYVGDVAGAIDRVAQGGLLVVPAAPALKDMASNESYREALVNADIAIADSAFMVLVWNFLEGDSIRRMSGLQYLQELLRQPAMRKPGNAFWVMAGKASSRKNLEWLKSAGVSVPENCVYEAPMYESKIEDLELIERLQFLRPQHVIITVGGGTQERLGLYLKRHLDYLPAIHCIGAAIAFLSGDQVRIPNWADKLYLGWLFRCLSSPRRYVPRYLSAPQLAPLIWRYRSQLPVVPESQPPLAHAE